MSTGITSGSVAIIPPQNPVSATSPNGGTNQDTIYTVPAGKTFYCIGIMASNSNALIANYVFKTGATVLFGGFAIPTNGNVSVTGQPLFTATTGQVITMNNTVGHNNNEGVIWGFLL
jgi:hypothetical protein